MKYKLSDAIDPMIENNNKRRKIKRACDIVSVLFILLTLMFLVVDNSCISEIALVLYVCLFLYMLLCLVM